MSPANSLLIQPLQLEALEAIASGTPLKDVADLLCLRVERLAPDVVCTILAVENGLLRTLASPSLPSDVSRAFDGVAIGPRKGSCGTAAFRGEAVEVQDIASDPLWADYKSLVLPLGLLACWSSPIFAADGRVRGTFAFYYRANRSPNELEREIVRMCAHLCAIALKNEDDRARNLFLACNDVLTGLPNRAGFDAMIGQRLAPGQAAFGLLLIDIDHLKSVNDTMGHGTGDALIRGVAKRIEEAARPGRACRLSGDEFAVLIDGAGDDAGLRACAERIIEAVRAPIACGEHRLGTYVTIGGVVAGEDGRDAETLRQNADFALYHAKETNRGGFVPFEQGLRTAITRRLRTIADVDAALGERRILANYQPIVRLDTAQIVGLEALARMKSREGVIVDANVFAAAMSDSRLAYGLTGRMLSEVARDVRSWLDAGIPFQHVGVNVTTGDFQKGDLEQRILDAFEFEGVPLRHVILEVNESVFMGGADKMVARAVEKLRARGLLVALDDFGTGFASLTHLMDFPVDIIKIDKSFVDGITRDGPGSAIVGAIIDIAAKMNIRIVAEGIETAEQADRLRSMGCVLGQGYHYARPASAAVTTDLLTRFAQGGVDAGRLGRRPRRTRKS
ncbi:bifunctional diguanylate cyclase/phosphodiesterase [Methylopila turkensis]|uniref:EAL domain-containing protein n=1 Tax=Methylopila turkensis TaxID=1437816 RepID=A0A9W6JSF0_9HYPH|nr:EAL domain-containing protein [Methylopila turkensis]GLK81464.1 hypothetical protein GCM10008174_32050 [Methylopila turkensis]